LYGALKVSVEEALLSHWTPLSQVTKPLVSAVQVSGKLSRALQLEPEHASDRAYCCPAPHEAK
jgi:hypothetical protein